MRSLYLWPLFPSNLEPFAARSLSIQLSLQELIRSFAILEEIQNAYPCPIESLLHHLEKLLLFSLENPFTKKAGTLDKLCFFSEELFRSSKITSKEKLTETLDQLRDLILNFRKKLLLSQKKPSEIPISTSNVEEFCTLLSRRLKIFYETLFPFLEEARFDENVLFYLIENKDILNKILLPKKVEDLLAMLHPSGQDHLRAILQEGYTRRGFSAFYTKHEALINSIVWQTDRCVLQIPNHSD